MARPFALKRFLRQTPLKLLEEYFRANQPDLDFSSLKDGDIAPLAEAILKLPASDRPGIESDFTDIDAVASERGLKALADEADWHIQNNPVKYGADRDLRQRLSVMENDHERAMWIRLNRPAYWHGTMRFFQADNLSPNVWHKRKDLPKKAALVNKKACNELGEAIGRHFHEAHGRGRLCAVEVFRRRDCDYYFCFGQGASEAPHAWVDGRLARQPLHRARDVIFIYSQVEGSLDTYGRGGIHEISALEAIFAHVILGHPDLQPADKDERVYELDVLKSADFPFRYDARSEIELVVIRSMRLSAKYGERPHIILQGDYSSNPQSVYDEMAGLKLPLEQLHVTQVEIGVHFTATPAKQNWHVLARLTHPNMCSLRYDGLDLVVRDMLKDLGLELQEPTS